MYADRVLIGRVEPELWASPEANEWMRMLPKGVGLANIASALQVFTEDELSRARDNIVQAVKKLDAEGVDVIDVGGSPVLGFKGYGAFQEFVDDLKGITSIPLVTSLGAEFSALKALGIKRVVAVTPYPDELNKTRRELLEDAGFEVLNLKGLGIGKLKDVHRLPEEASYKLAKEAYMEAPDADGIYICCPSWPTVGNIAKLEDELKRPVVTNAQAQVWACLSAADYNEPIHGFGKLLTML